MKRQWQGGSLLFCALPGAHADTTRRRLIGFRLELGEHPGELVVEGGLAPGP